MPENHQLDMLAFDQIKQFNRTGADRVRCPGEIVTRDRLPLRGVGLGAENVPATRTVDNHVAKLRQKIGADRIETVQKVGYRFVP